MEEELTPEVYAERNSWLVPGNKDCILALYRSAVKIGEEWQPGVEQIKLPSMVIWGRNDPYVELSWGERLAAWSWCSRMSTTRRRSPC
jgi:pimeloyl-ACP methyl ester carboxylesterase